MQLRFEIGPQPVLGLRCLHDYHTHMTQLPNSQKTHYVSINEAAPVDVI